MSDRNIGHFFYTLRKLKKKKDTEASFYILNAKII